MKLAALIIAHGSAAHIGACLESCLRWRGDFEAGLLVVDNAPGEGSDEVVRGFAGVRLISNAVNRGFAGAVNQGMEELAAAEAVLVLNPDVRIESRPQVLARALEQDRKTAVAGGVLIGADGEAQRGFYLRRLPVPAALAFEALGVNRLFPRNPVNRRYRALDVAVDLPARDLQPAGACMLVRRAAWQAVGGFDEGFHPLWFEDVDFTARLMEAGWTTLHVPRFRATHTGGHSAARLGWEARQLYWYSSLFRYVSKHFGPSGRWAVCLPVVIGFAVRTLGGIVSERSIRPLAVCGKVVRLAVATLAASAPRKAIVRSSEDSCEPAGSRERTGA